MSEVGRRASRRSRSHGAGQAQGETPGSPGSDRKRKRCRSKDSFVAVREPFLYNTSLDTTQKMFLMCVADHDWGGGKGGIPCNDTLARACSFQGMHRAKSVRRVMESLINEDLLTVEYVEPSDLNPTGRILYLTEKTRALLDIRVTARQRVDCEQKSIPTADRTPGPAAPPRGGLQASSPRGLQAPRIDHSSSLDHNTDHLRGKTVGKKPFNDDDKREARLMVAVATCERGEPARPSDEPPIPSSRPSEPSLVSNGEKPFGSLSSDEKTAAMQRLLLQNRADWQREQADRGEKLPNRMASSLDRKMDDARFLATMADEPINADPPRLAKLRSPEQSWVRTGRKSIHATGSGTPEARSFNSTSGYDEFCSRLDQDQRIRFEGLSPRKRAEILEPHEEGFNEAVYTVSLGEIMKARPPGEVPVQPETTEDLIQLVANGDAASICTAAEAVSQDFRDDRKRWGAIKALFDDLHQGVVTAETVLDAYRQAMKPECRVPGAVFTKALHDMGWRPGLRTHDSRTR